MSGGRKPAGEDQRVCVGAIAGAFGVRGEARLKVFTADPAAVADYGPLESEDGARRFTIKVTRAVKGGLAARLSGVATREEAEALKGVRLYAPRAALPEPADEEFYHADLIGLTVVDLADATLGEIVAVHDFGAGDMLEIRRPDARRTALLPFTRDAAPHVDLRAGVVVADPPAGVFDDGGEDENDREDDGDDVDAGSAGGAG